MKRERGYWTKEKAFEIAKTFKNRSEFEKKESGAYYFLIRNSILDEACMHMNYQNVTIQPQKTEIKDMPYVDYGDLKSVVSFVNSPEISFKDEIWKTHPIYDFIEASNFGRIRTKTRTITFTDKNRGICKRTIYGKIIKQEEHMTGKGYLSHCVKMRGKKIGGNKTHQLIMDCFFGVNNDKRNILVDHINGIRYDNRLSNLRYVTPKLNSNNEITKQKAILNRQKSGNYSHYFKKYKKHKDKQFKEIRKNVFISNYGVIFLKNKKAYTKGHPNEDGYLLYGGKRVHRLVAEAFLTNPLNLPIIDHIDGDKTNNKLYNLRWVSRNENAQNPATKIGEKPVNQYTLNGVFLKCFKSLTETKNDGFDFRLVSAVCLGKRKTHSGYIWKFAEGNL